MVTDLKMLLQQWKEDPVLFVIDMFGEKPYSKQKQILHAIKNKRRVAVRSGHGVGKTKVAAWVAWWFFVTHPHSKVITTAPTGRQLRKVLWAELQSLARKIPPVIRANFEILETDIYMRDKAGRRINDWFITARTSDKPENMLGFHAPFLLYIVDETSGVPDEIYNAIEGSMTTEAKMLLIGNPTRTTGYFYDAFHSKADLWERIHISCFESPFVNPAWIEEKKREWGIDSDLYRVKVLGEFPRASADSLLPIDWIDRATNAEINIENGEIRIGVDVARFGTDETVIMVIESDGLNARVVHYEAMMGKETTLTARRALHLAQKYGAAMINVDDTGVGGGVTDILREEVAEKGLDIQINPVVFGAAPMESPELYANLKAQLYFKLRDYMNPETPGGISIPDEPKLIRDLSAIRIGYTSRDKIKIIDPPKSPDYADALVIALAKTEVMKGTAMPPGFK